MISKVESEGLREAFKFQPSILSIQIWMLSRKSNEDNDQTDKTNPSVDYEKSEDFCNILNRLVSSASEPTEIPQTELEKRNDLSDNAGQKEDNILNLCKNEVLDDFSDHEEYQLMKNGKIFWFFIWHIEEYIFNIR